jgi:hypothetical protein
MLQRLTWRFRLRNVSTGRFFHPVAYLLPQTHGGNCTSQSGRGGDTTVPYPVLNPGVGFEGEVA